jgi:plastocyanin
MDRQRPVVLSAAAISVVIAVFALVMAWTTTDDGSDAAGTSAPPAAGAPATTASTGATGASDAATSTFDITIDNFEFSPGDAKVAPGTTVVFTNDDSVDHSIVADGDAFAASPTLKSGDTYRVTLTEPGSYRYKCGIHSFMTGTITVQG